MENDKDTGKTPEEPKVTAPPAPPRKPSSSGKWIAVIIALLVVVGVLGALVATHYGAPSAGVTGPSSTLSASTGAISQGDTYTGNITASGSFKNMTVYYGDGSSQLINYSNSNSVKVSHKYANPGEYYILASINYGSSTGYFLQPVKVSPNYPTIEYAYRALTVDPSSSSAQFVNNLSNIFGPNSHMTLNFVPPVGGGTNQIVSQELIMSNQSGMVSDNPIAYAYNINSGGYQLPLSTVNYGGMQPGIYMLNISTTTAPVNTTQSVTTTVTNTASTAYAAYLDNGLGSINAIFPAASSISGVANLNQTISTSSTTNLTFSMGDNITFSGTKTLLNVSSAVNLTLVGGGTSAYYFNGTYSHKINSTYSMVPAGFEVQANGSNQIMFNSGVTAMVIGSTSMSFTGKYTLGFVNDIQVGLTNTNGATTVSSGVTYNAGTAFSNLNGASATMPSKTNVTVTNGTKMSFTGAEANVTMMSTSNVTLTSGKIYNMTSSKVLTAVHGNYYKLNNTDKYNLTLSTVVFNSGKTKMNIVGITPVTFGKGTYTLTLMNKTAGVKFGTPANAKVWNSISVTKQLLGTSTIALNNGQYDQSKTITTYYYEDFVITSKVTPQKATTTSFTNAEPNAPGGYTTLDPSIAYYTADSEILNNALMQLDTYNGSSTSNFVPMAAKTLPTLGNGINNAWENSSKNPGKQNLITTPWGAQYNYTTAPGQNYTFQINSAIKFQGGQSMSAWDVMYTFTRTLLFDAASPGTGGWVIAQYLLPGDYFSSNTFYNITQNITVDNASNSITFHFQTPMSPSLVFQIFASSGTWIEPASWFEAHGAGITWNATGFQKYKSEGDIQNYNSYVQNHIDASGPYMVSYIIPGSQVTMVINPAFVQPNNYYRNPTINTINILYLSSNEQAFLLLKSGQAQNAALPTSYWNQTQAMVSSGFLQQHSFPTLGVFFYNFNVNTNLSILSSVTKSANVPSNLFLNPNVRKAFAYAYNYSLYYAKQVGNEIYNTTFLAPYAGMLPPGMLYQQTEQDLINNGTPVVNANGHEPFQLTMAKKYWNIFMNSGARDGAAAMGLTTSGGKVVMSNGNPLNIPIMIPNSDPTDKAAVTTWASDIAQVIPGAQAFPVELPLTDIFATYLIPQQNPMPISWGGWAPDYPYPTDYLLPMGEPLNGSTYMGPAGFVPYIVSGNNTAGIKNMTEVGQMMQMLSAQKNATNNATNPTEAKYWFQKVNEMIVNSTMEVYIGQQTLHWIMSSKLNSTDIVNYQENVMIGGGQDLQYNLMSYT